MKARIFEIALFPILLLTLMQVNLMGHGKEKHWRAPKIKQDRVNPVEVNSTSMKSGKMIFDEHCSGCHGNDDDAAEDIDSDGPPHVTKLGHHKDGEIAWKIKTGKGDMPAWKNKISDKEIWDTVNYLKGLKHQ